MNFNVSDKVVCVDASPVVTGWKLLVVGQVYVIRGIDTITMPRNWPPSTVGLLLVGLPYRVSKRGHEIGWASVRFRKLDEIKAENTAKSAMEMIS